MNQVEIETLLNYILFVDASPIKKNEVVTVGLFQPAIEEGEMASQLFWHTEAGWFAGPLFEFEAVSVAVNEDTKAATVLGRDGEIAIVMSENIVEIGKIALNEQPCMGGFRKLQSSSGKLIAIGGVRDIYKINGTESHLITNGDVKPLLGTSEEAIVNEIIDDNDLWFDAVINEDNSIYAVGSNGRADLIQNTHLSKIDLGTNIPLYTICTLSNRRLFIGGHKGRCFCGSGDVWMEMNPILGASNLCSSIEFKNHLFVCDGKNIYQKSRQVDDFTLVNMGTSSPVPANKLRANSNTLITISAKELFITNDCENWFSLLN